MLHSNAKTVLTLAITRRAALSLIAVLSLLAVPTGVTRADEPGRGLTADFEVDYLRFIINHHFAALRMTELAAGSDRGRDAAISPTEGTAPSPGFGLTAAKASLDGLKQIARRNNRMQREEILQAQTFLRRWYGIEYQPQLTERNRRAIGLLEQAAAGRDFDIAFVEVFSRHHFIASQRSLECLVGSELRHKDLERYCRGIVMSQLNDIDEMRDLICDNYNICDYQPFGGLNGRRSGRPPVDNIPGDSDEDGETDH